MLEWYRKLIQLRRSTPSLNDGEPGNTKVAFSEEQKWLCMTRGSIVVACNLASSSRSIQAVSDAALFLPRGRTSPSRTAPSFCRPIPSQSFEPMQNFSNVESSRAVQAPRAPVQLRSAGPWARSFDRSTRPSSDRLTRSRDPRPTASASVSTMPPNRIPNASSTMFPPT